MTKRAGCTGNREPARRPDDARDSTTPYRPVKPLVAPPPAGAVECRMIEVCGCRQRRGSRGKRGRPQWIATRVEGTGFIKAVTPRQQRVPVDRAEQRPHGDGPDIGTLGLEF